MTTDYDILIIGGGMVGASLACALGRDTAQPQVGVVEAMAFNHVQQPSYDARTTGLSYGSRRILESMGVWDGIAAEAVPIKKIHISDRGHFGRTRLASADHGVEAFGYIVENRVLGAAMMQRMMAAANVELLCPATLRDLNVDTDAAHATIVRDDGREQLLHARLVVIADGQKSVARERLGISTKQRDYDQSALVTTVTAECGHDHTAFERFTRTGPLAVLPLKENRCAVVWTLRADEVEAVLAQGDAEFLQGLQAHFGSRLGRLSAPGTRRAYPLALQCAETLVRPRAVLIGNAAHTLHPIAAQGFNLGLRDAAVLAGLVRETVSHGGDPGDVQLLEHYARQRARDQRGVAAFTDGLVRLFSNDFLPLVLARNAALVAADIIPALKRSIGRRAMGLAHYSRLRRQTRV